MIDILKSRKLWDTVVAVFKPKWNSLIQNNENPKKSCQHYPCQQHQKALHPVWKKMQSKRQPNKTVDMKKNITS